MTTFKGPDGQEDMPYLLTPGTVTTSRDVKFAMLADWNPRDSEFMSLVKSLQEKLKKLGGCDAAYSCVMLQGSASTGIEAALSTFAPTKRKKTLIVANGPAGQNALHIMQRISRNHALLDCEETKPLQAADVAKALDADRNITHVWVVHCETASGIVNPVAEIAKEVKSRGRTMMLDETTSFGGLPLNMVELGVDVLLSGSGYCLESVPGLAFVLARNEALEAAKDQSHSMALDLQTQWQHFETTGQFDVISPTHLFMALHQALRELEAEGSIEGRNQRYRKTASTLITRIKALGFSTLLPDHEAGPFVQTILAPRDARFDIAVFIKNLRKSGFAISKGALSKRESFRISTIGKIDDKIIIQLISAIEAAMIAMNVRDFAPSKE
jgi:2-aminoethylphosphonate-pyruvate transaminase